MGTEAKAPPKSVKTWTVRGILDLMERMRTCDQPPLVNHVKTLEGPRTVGGTTRGALDFLPDDRELTDITEELPEAVRHPRYQYFRLSASEIEPQLHVISYRTAVSTYGADNIKERKGSSGLMELYIDSPDHPPSIPTLSTVIVVLGPQGDWAQQGFDRVMLEWRPGLPLRPFDGKNRTDFTEVHLK